MSESSSNPSDQASENTSAVSMTIQAEGQSTASAPSKKASKKTASTSSEATLDTTLVSDVKKTMKQTARYRLKQGGFVRNGLDGARYHLMETRCGVQALKVFTTIGQLAPIYINQQFFDSLHEVS